ncbi:Bug family tripartite tricarboxylate transporter substrate binding protein [Caldovatus aquaticus]|uniref:Tripartite tricarboxylate transporter substrate binding protein n=1 Tax=Caldovatus aquaticus TaxID=2865671 RepID=A0ABS7F347_9PROT|nr:tripartite tricarboxylate transporter substrate binding protein [Caldovatus aquaticus]MBW8270035.1 tripartite tricarboxylate transporter substrate binding protein [Caldovatus aquaticus]
MTQPSGLRRTASPPLPVAPGRPRLSRRALAGLAATPPMAALAPRRLAAADPPWPARPITLVIAYPPGAITDTVGRKVGDRLSAALGMPVVIENRGGAGGNLAAGVVARAQPDGHTLLFTSYGNLLIAAAADLRLDFHPQRDLAPIALIGPMTVVLLVRPDLPVRTIEEFVAYARAHPGRLNFASVGVGSSYHLLIEQMIAFGRLDMLHVPYRGGTAAMADFLGGRVDAMLATLLFARPYINDNRARAIAVANGERSPVLPDLPTVGERAVPGARLVDGLGVMGPARLPAPVVRRVNAAVQDILRQPDMHAWLTGEGVVPRPAPPEAFAAMLREEAEPLRRLIRDNNIRLE